MPVPTDQPGLPTSDRGASATPGTDTVLTGRSRAGLVVAIDGPSGSGKSSVSRAVATVLKVAFLDTGAMYRAVTFSALRAGVDLDDPAAVAAHVRGVPLWMGTDPQDPTVAVVEADGSRSDVTAAIRSAEVTGSVSAVAAVQAVRSDLILRQRALIEAACASPVAGRLPGVVAEGRDITTVVAPQADVRVLLTAQEQVRLSRRARQDLGAADTAELAATYRSVVERDVVDSRTTAFRDAADGVVTVDSTHLDFDGTVEAVLAVVRAAVPTDPTS